MHLTKPQLFEKLYHALAADYNCAPSAFCQSNHVLTASKVLPGRRAYIQDPYFLQMATFGRNAVLCADPSIHGALSAFIKDSTGPALFEHRVLSRLDALLAPYGKQLWQVHHMYLPHMDPLPVSDLAPVRWLEQQDLAPFYQTGQFPNALCKQFDLNRPDMLAVAACQGDQFLAMAGCSADMPDFWQIGIDVLPPYRGKGLGRYLVILLKNEIIRRGKIPFYGTSTANLYSQNIAASSGFFPAWAETQTMEQQA